MLVLITLACAEPEPAQKPASVAQKEAAPKAEAAPAAAPKPAAAEARSVTAAGLKTELDAKKVPVLVDVRTPGEYGGGHVPGAKSIPIDELPSRVSELEAFKTGPVYVICASGGRSARGAALLSSQGFDAVNVSDGTSAWVAAGFPVER